MTSGADPLDDLRPRTGPDRGLLDGAEGGTTMNEPRTETGRRLLAENHEDDLFDPNPDFWDQAGPSFNLDKLRAAILAIEAEATRTADRPSLREAALEHIILDGGLRLPDFDHWRERASSKPSDPDDVRWDCSCGYSGSPEKVRRHWAALRQALEDDGT